MSDSECDQRSNSTDIEHNTELLGKSISKRKSTSVKKSAANIRKKSKSVDIFNLSRGGDKSNKSTSSTAALSSYFVNRVANGNERRAINTTGDYLIDLKVYHTNDARISDPLDLWKKALIRIKFQTEDDTPQWRKLQSLVHSVDTLCEDHPSFLSN